LSHSIPDDMELSASLHGLGRNATFACPRIKASTSKNSLRVETTLKLSRPLFALGDTESRTIGKFTGPTIEREMDFGTLVSRLQPFNCICGIFGGNAHRCARVRVNVHGPATCFLALGPTNQCYRCSHGRCRQQKSRPKKKRSNQLTNAHGFPSRTLDFWEDDGLEMKKCQASIARLKATLSTEKWNRLVPTFSGERIKIYHNLPALFANSWNPIFDGQFVQSSSGSRLVGYFRVHWFVFVFILVFLGVCLFQLYDAWSQPEVMPGMAAGWREHNISFSFQFLGFFMLINILGWAIGIPYQRRMLAAIQEAANDR
jgi:hypothetical protein